MAVDELDLFMSKLEDRGIITGWSEFMQKEENDSEERMEDRGGSKTYGNRIRGTGEITKV